MRNKDLTPEQRYKKTVRQRELRKMHPERYRNYDHTPKREFSKKVYNWKRKFIAMRLVQPSGDLKCKICGNNNFLALTIDHVDESGSESNLYQKLICEKSQVKDKQILCFSCNAVLRILGHNDDDRVKDFVLQYNEARRQSIEEGYISEENFPELSFPQALKMAGN